RIFPLVLGDVGLEYTAEDPILERARQRDMTGTLHHPHSVDGSPSIRRAVPPGDGGVERPAFPVRESVRRVGGVADDQLILARWGPELAEGGRPVGRRIGMALGKEPLPEPLPALMEHRLVVFDFPRKELLTGDVVERVLGNEL